MTFQRFSMCLAFVTPFVWATAAASAAAATATGSVTTLASASATVTAPAAEPLALVGAADADVRDAFAAHPAVALQARDVTAGFLDEAARLDRACDAALDQCLLDDAGLCGVPLAAHAAARGDVLVLRVAVVATASVRVVTLNLTGASAARRAALLREGVAQLVAPSTVGTLTIEAPTGSLIAVDGVDRGLSPLSGPLVGVAPGAHIVEVTLPEGGGREGRRVTTSARRNVRVLIAPRPFVASALTWGGAGLAVAALVPASVAVFFSTQYAAAQSVLERTETDYELTAADSDLNDDGVRRDIIAAHKQATEAGAVVAPTIAIASAMAVVAGVGVTMGVAWQQLFGWSVEETE